MSAPEGTSGFSDDNDYVSRQGQTGGIPVQSDDAPVEDNIGADADSDAALARDDKEAINQDNIIGGGRTRGAKPSGGYQEPGDEEGLPSDDGTSAVTQETKTQ